MQRFAESEKVEGPWAATGTETPEIMKSRTSLINRPRELGTYYEATVPDTLDLAELARLGIHHFTSSISEAHSYEMLWGAMNTEDPTPDVLEYAGLPDRGSGLGYNIGDCNPAVASFAWSSLHACQPKAMEVMAMERLMSGSVQGLEIEAKMLKMLTSNIEEGLYWVQKDPERPWLGKDEDRPHANIHGQGRMIRAMIAWYQYTGNPAYELWIDEMIEGLDRIAEHKTDYAYYPTEGWIPFEYFRSCYVKGRGWKSIAEPEHEKHGEEESLFNHQGHLPGAMATWYEMTGNEQAIRLSGELVRFLTKPKFWADWEKGGYPKVVGEEHAHWTGHYHGYVNTLRAILEYAVAMNDSRLKAFVRDGYEWTRQANFSRIGLVGDGQGCACGRLIGLAVKLSDCGIGDYWEDVDLYIRNHGIEMQITPDDVDWLKSRCEGKPEAPDHPSQINNGVIELSVGAYTIYKLPFKSATALCCSTHGNMGLFYAWDGIIRFENGRAQVNLLLNRASPWMDVDSYLPYEGKVVLRNKKAQEAFVRVPLWVDRKAVRGKIHGKEIENVWFGNYLRFSRLGPEDVITIEFPMVERTETWTIPKLTWPGPETRSHTCRFRGNTVVDITPPFMEDSPIYQDRPEKYKKVRAPLKNVVRYVSPIVLRW